MPLFWILIVVVAFVGFVGLTLCVSASRADRRAPKPPGLDHSRCEWGCECNPSYGGGASMPCRAKKKWF